jgi:hypothetical protein
VGIHLGDLPAEAVRPRLQRRRLRAARIGGALARGAGRPRRRRRRQPRPIQADPRRGRRRAGRRPREARHPARPDRQDEGDREAEPENHFLLWHDLEDERRAIEAGAAGGRQRLRLPGPRRARDDRARVQGRNGHRPGRQARDARRRRQPAAPLPPGDLRRHRPQVPRHRPGLAPHPPLRPDLQGDCRHDLRRDRARGAPGLRGEVAPRHRDADAHVRDHPPVTASAGSRLGGHAPLHRDRAAGGARRALDRPTTTASTRRG